MEVHAYTKDCQSVEDRSGAFVGLKGFLGYLGFENQVACRLSM